jgi:hypothetical protein
LFSKAFFLNLIINSVNHETEGFNYREAREERREDGEGRRAVAKGGRGMEAGAATELEK